MTNLSETYYSEKYNLETKNEIKLKIPDQDLDYDVNSILWWAHRGNYGIDWMYYTMIDEDPIFYEYLTIDEILNMNETIQKIVSIGSTLPFTAPHKKKCKKKGLKNFRYDPIFFLRG